MKHFVSQPHETIKHLFSDLEIIVNCKLAMQGRILQKSEGAKIDQREEAYKSGPATN